MSFFRKRPTRTDVPPPVVMDTAARARMTIGCRDANSIPKVANAGAIETFEGVTVQIMHNGLRVVAGGYYGDWMTGIINALKGHHEPQEELVFHEVMKLIPPDATMIELGGHWSYYSLWFKAGHSQRRAVVVEPDPEHLSVGRQNARLNSCTLEFVQASAGDAPQPPRSFQTETAGRIQIPQVAVDELMARFGFTTLDVLHCDTQGAETKVIASCEALMKAGRIRFGIFSTHSHHISGDPLTHQKCLQLVQDFGGRVLAEHDVHESFSGDGLIAAYFGNDDLAWTEPVLSRNRYSTSLFRNPLYDLQELSRR